MMAKRSIDELLHQMPAVAENTDNAWVKGFAQEMAERRWWRHWKPTPKQEALMRKLVAQLFEPDLVVIDE